MKHWLLGAVWFWCSAGAASAQDMPFHIPQYTGTPLMIATGVVTQQTLQRSLTPVLSRSGGVPGAKAAPSGPAKLVVGSAPAGVAKQLARSAPPEQQAAVEQAYGLILAKHPQLMRQLGVPSDDLACAVATLLTGSYIAYRDIDFPDALFKVVYEQVRSGLASTPQLAQLDMTKRREIYEQAAIIGTFFAVTHSVLKTQPDPARAASMRAAGRASLEQFLKVDPDRLELTERGFSVRAH